MYIDPSFRTKDGLKKAIENNVPVVQEQEIVEGEVRIEGAYYPGVQRWYAMVKVRDNLVMEVLS